MRFKSVGLPTVLAAVGDSTKMGMRKIEQVAKKVGAEYYGDSNKISPEIQNKLSAGKGQEVDV